MMCQHKHTDSDHSRESYQTDWTAYNHPSTAVVEAVAQATGRDQTDLHALYDYLDGDALDALLGAADTALTVSFTYDDAWVDISATGSLTVWIED
jgi:hypothetical protein